MDFHELAMTALRATVIYVVLLVIVRLLGKRTIGSATAFDFMVALILSEVVDEPIYGDVPLVQGLLVIAIVAGWHAVNSSLSYRSRRFDRLAGGEPTVLVKHGVMDRRGMKQERINEEELWTAASASISSWALARRRSCATAGSCPGASGRNG